VAETKPGIADVKRLFASSGDRCAFPRCTAPIAFGGTIVGVVCHIKGEKPRNARHDSKQTNAERHAYENLIQMCANHHRVIDDDVESYTVERLYKIKK